MNSLPTNHRLLVIDDNRAIHDDFRKILGETPATLELLDEAEAALLGEGAGGPVTKGFALDSAYQGQEALELVQ